MKLTLLFSILFLHSSLYAFNINSLGSNSSDTLTVDEIEYFDSMIKNKPVNFKLSNKRVAFVTGNSGSVILKKSQYFNKIVKPRFQHSKTVKASIVILDSTEKRISGGYDVIILSWVKLFSNWQKENILETLGE